MYQIAKFNTTKNIAPQSVWQNPWHFITFGFGSGAFPYAPGTFGTLFSIPFYLLAVQWGQGVYALLTLALIAVGAYLCGKTCEEIGVHDHPGTVLDEFVGFFVTMLFVPVHWFWIVLGVSLFRLFDIVKPYPINLIDKHMPGGLGVVLDDVVAGIFSCIILNLLAWLI